MVRLLITTLLLAAALACSDGSISVTADEYGDAWPFAVNSGRIRCTKYAPDTNTRRPYVLFVAGDVEYGINGAAKGVGGFPDGLTILKPGKTGADLQPFIDRGLTLCQP